MHWKVRRSFFSRVEMFEGLGGRDLNALAKTCKEAHYADREVLCRQGERGITAFLIISGKVQVENELDNGDIVIVAELEQGSMVGELSVIDGAERVATVRAIGDIEALVLTQWNMQALIKTRPSIAAAMLPVIVKRFRDTANELRRRDRESSRGREAAYH